MCGPLVREQPSLDSVAGICRYEDQDQQNHHGTVQM